MKNAMQLKAIVKNIAKEKNTTAHVVLQNYMLERLLERISLSEYKQKFILKGGMLIAAMVGLDSRTTMDMDATIKGYPLTEESIKDAFQKIIQIVINDDITFELKSIGLIRESGDYGGFRVTLEAILGKIKVPLKVDITTGDKITPGEVSYRFELMLEKRYIEIYAYNLETVMAEKVETIMSRGTLNTRPRDFYDVYILTKLQSHNIDKKLLDLAIEKTSNNRGTNELIKNPQKIIVEISESEEMKQRWKLYQKEHFYADDINFDDVMNCIKTYL